jgi:hypothetical protein
MMKCRPTEAGLPAHDWPHSSCVATVTDMLDQAVEFEEVRHLAGHAARGTRGPATADAM